MYKNILFLDSGSDITYNYIKWVKQVPGVKFTIACDMNKYSPSLCLADVGIVTPIATSKEYPRVIQNIVDKYQIDYIFPLFENGFENLKKVNANFGVDLDSAILCRDKYKFYLRCKDLGIPVPQTFMLNEYQDSGRYPMYVKPRIGSGGKNNFVVKMQSELEGLKSFLNESLQNYIIQEFLEGPHWGADVLAENNEVITVVTRKTLGKTYRVETIQNNALIEFSKKVQKLLQIKKIFNIEVFEVSPNNFVINEINGRMGGNCICSSLAGCDIVSYLITKDKKYLGEVKNGSYAIYADQVKLNLNNTENA
ncbi:ATP-grasp domain-containing protein [Candidatus Dojkabacteria bacterium]|jgi:carbamoyl-phosphate synthase large subunit|nr:ATP-grasp domain-containing protein [Candidatus Dojkabacteria bacterium]